MPRTPTLTPEQIAALERLPGWDEWMAEGDEKDAGKPRASVAAGKHHGDEARKAKATTNMTYSQFTGRTVDFADWYQVLDQVSFCCHYSNTESLVYLLTDALAWMIQNTARVQLTDDEASDFEQIIQDIKATELTATSLRKLSFLTNM
jgi:hypothetical protein